MAEIMRNPPLFAYLLAGFGAVFGWSEVGLHLLLIIPAAAAVLGTYFLARRLCGAPLWAAALTLFSPVFLVSATTVMCDVTMLAFWVWALALWMRGLDEGRRTDVATAVVMATLCVLTKYNGAAVLLLMAIYALWKPRAAVLVYLSMPIAAAVGYHQFASSHYGSSTVQSGVAMAAHFTPEALSKAFVALSFTGGCAGLALLFARGVWSVRGAFAALIGAGALLVIEMTWGFPVKLKPGTLATASQFAVMVAAGVGLMWMAAADFRSSRSAESAIIGLWLAGTFVFAAFISWAIGGRYLLPMAPAAAILIIRRLESTAGATDKTAARAALFALISHRADIVCGSVVGRVFS
jgi:4-amino-4-deoxy-L-arabinose transferase-like glycosyltransferase